MGRKLIDITGNIYNNLQVIRLDPERSTNKVKYWICKCKCGNYTSVELTKLKNGNIKGCGCLRGKNNIKIVNNKKIYKRWSHMKSRCERKNDISYKNYGARGIKVCDEWKDYTNFEKWSLENGYADNLELDRIDNNGNYEPSNCRYVTRTQNARNKRTTIKYWYKGKYIPLKEIAEINNMNYKILWQRIHRNNKTLEEALIK